MADTQDPSTPSGDYSAMCEYWDMVDAILGGAPAMRAATRSTQTYLPGPAQPVPQLNELQRSVIQRTANESPYLPKFPNEDPMAYELRRRHAPLTNIYADVSDNLAGKPFAKECKLADDAPPDLKKLAENIDGQGHTFHVFSRPMFKNGLDKGVSWLLVDYTNVPPGATLADERNMGARPYWVYIEANRMLSVHDAFINGKREFYEARIRETSIVADGYGEKQIERVRKLYREPTIDSTGRIVALGPATWELLEKTENEKKEVTWVRIDSGVYTIGFLPLVPFVPVGRVGTSWQVKPAFKDIAYMQVEEFQQESNLKTIKELSAFPMLSGNGVSLDPNNPITVGPHTILTAPMGADGSFGNWTIVEPAATSMTFQKEDLAALRKEMRDLGRQPLADANLTVVTTANIAMRAHSAVQAWALLFKDALEQAWAITAKWLGSDAEVEVKLHLDFGADTDSSAKVTSLLAMRKNNDLSQETLWDECKRYGLLSDEFDSEEEQQKLAEEQQGQQLQPEKMIDPVTGAPVVVTPQHGTLNPQPVPPKKPAQ